MSPPRFPLAYTVCTPDCRRPNPMAYDADLAAATRELAELGYDGVELQVRDPGALDATSLLALLGDHGLAPVALATGHLGSEDGLRLHGPEDVRTRTIQRLHAVVDLAAELGSLVTIGSVRGAPQEPTEIEHVRQALGRVAGHAADVGVRMVLEPQNRFVGPYLTTVAATVELIEDAGWEAVGIVADTFHMNLEERSLPGALVRAGSHLWHVQLGENHRAALGSGTLPLTAVLDTLDALSYAGWLVMEHAQGADSRAAAATSLHAVRAATADLPPLGA